MSAPIRLKPSHIMRQSKKPPSLGTRLGGAQGSSLHYREAPVTLPSPPWESADAERHTKTTPTAESQQNV